MCSFICPGLGVELRLFATAPNVQFPLSNRRDMDLIFMLFLHSLFDVRELSQYSVVSYLAVFLPFEVCSELSF